MKPLFLIRKKDVVAVMSGSLKPYFYFVFRFAAGLNTLQQCLKTFQIVGNGKDIGQQFALSVQNKTVLILRHINSNAYHKKYPKIKNL